MMTADQERAATVAKGLTKAQREALLHERAGRCSYGWTTIGTLTALHSRGLVGRVGSVGSMFSPQTATNWPLTPLGLAVREHLLGSKTDD